MPEGQRGSPFIPHPSSLILHPLNSHEPPPTTLPPGSIVDAYLRDSGGLKQDRSIARQLEALTAYCKEYGLILRTPYKDAAKSGTTTAGRDNFLRMIADYETPINRPAALLIWNYARFARDVDDSQLYKAIIRRWKIIIHSLTDKIPEGRYGRLIEMLIEISNEEKAQQTATDAADGLRSIVQQGAMPGVPPKGFKREPIVTTNLRTGEPRTNHRWVPDPDWIPRVQRAFQMKSEGATLIQIHKETQLFQTLNSYITFFSNELYIGTLHFGNLTIEHYCDPIIDPATWQIVKQILALHAGRMHMSSPTHIHPRRKAEAATYPLSGITICARCKAPLYGMSSQQRNGSYYRRYACTRRTRRRDCDFTPIPANTLEKEVINKVSAFFEHPENLAALLEADVQRNADLASKNKAVIKDLQRQITTLRRSITNITTAIAERGHSKAMLNKLADLEGQETDLQSQIHTVQSGAQRSRSAYTPAQIKLLSERVTARLKTKDNNLLRNILLGTINQIIVDRTENQVFGTIIINIPMESEPPK